jgi:hypothetical protein
MDETKIELSDKGITFPYRRYLSDSASGFVLILLFSIFVEKSPSIQAFLDVKFPSEVRVFILVLLFLLSTPIGVMINVISWMIFESPQKAIEKILINRGFGLFKKEYMFSESMSGLDIKKENWFEKIRLTEAKLANKHSIFIDKIESLRGIAILVRNLSLIGTVTAIYMITAGYHLEVILFCFALSLFLLYVSAVVSFYFHVQIVFWGYTSFVSQQNKKG